MKLSTIKRITKESLSLGGGELPEWVDRFLPVLNDYLEKMYIAVSGRLTFADNFQSSTVIVELTHDVETKVSTRSNLNTFGCLLVNTSGIMSTGFKWATKSDGSIGLTVQLSGATKATCTVIFLLR